MSSTSSLTDPEKDGSPRTLNPATSLEQVKKVTLSDVDVAARLTAGLDLNTVDEAEAKRVL